MYDVSKIIEHEVDQRSKDWFDLRAGRLTGSHFAEIMPSAKARTPWTQAQDKVIYRIAAEILTRQADRKFFVSDAMQWGIDHESEAVGAVCLELLLNNRDCGIFQRGEYIASSPDAILGDNELTLEVKCPSSAVHLQYLKDPETLWNNYKWQVLGEMYCTGIGQGVLASFDPRFPDGKDLVIYHPKDYQDDIKRLEDRLGEVEERIKGLIK